MEINKRKFTGSCVPLGTPLGKILTNCKESREISRAISKLKHGEKVIVKLSEETQDIINRLKNR
jgi:hypothetical protein